MRTASLASLARSTAPRRSDVADLQQRLAFRLLQGYCHRCGGLFSPPRAGPPLAPEAERRQITVMFCDLVGSTELSERLDLEEFRDVIQTYQRVTAEVVARFEGHVAQYLGDGILVYFGYPQAHEDDALRAVRTALGIIEATSLIDSPPNMRSAIRIGIHTGLTVVGDVGIGTRQEYLALGEAPNLAARLQGVAAPDTVVVSAATYRLLRGLFDAQDLGLHALKGISIPIQIYRIHGEAHRRARARISAAGRAGRRRSMDGTY
jgi:class 3 adenylate cyclase